MVGPLASLIQTRQPDAATLAPMVEELTDRFRPYQSAAGVRIPATLHYVTALRP